MDLLSPTAAKNPGFSLIRWGLALAMLTALLLPLNLLTSQPFHHDEALYATWALPIASGSNPWLTAIPIDKPPLFLYTIAASMWLLGPTLTAARLPSLIATVITVGLTFRLGQTLYNDAVGLIAAWLVALSPLSLMLAPTALTDPLLVTLALAGCLAAAQGGAIWAGVWLGLALATKQQGLFFIPLALGLFWIRCYAASDRSPPHPSIRSRYSGCWGLLNIETNSTNTAFSRLTFYVLRFTFYVLYALPLLLTTALIFLPALWWDWNRHQPGFWQLSLTNYGGLAVGSGHFADRWSGFLDILAYATASPLLNTIFLLGLPLLLIYDTYRLLRPTPNTLPHLTPPPPTLPLSHSPNLPLSPSPNLSIPHSPNPPISPSPHPPIPPLTDLLLILFSLIFLLGHVLLSFQVWDRYLLGLVPLLALLLARMVWLPWLLLKKWWPTPRHPWSRLAGAALLLLLLTVQIGPVRDAANARYPLGSHSAALSGIDQIVAYLRSNVGADTTLYHHWLGSQWRFHLWSYPYDLQYWAAPTALAERAAPGHLIAFPTWRSETEARLALAAAGFRLREISRAYAPTGQPSIILYRIE